MNRKEFLLLLATSPLLFTRCSSDDEEIISTSPFDSDSESRNYVRNKIVIISDLHLGSNLSYSETVAHLERLEEFLNEVRSSATIKELVMAGDIFDEWYIPTRVEPYAGGTQSDFIRSTVESNQGVFDILNGIIQDGKIKLTYIPGNHDMGITAESVDIALPGVHQARDAGEKFGIGTYYPDDYSEIAIEHGHRYDFFNAITPNATDAAGATLPPGFFFARIAANSFTDPTTAEAATAVPLVTLNEPTNPEQYSKYVYYSLWKKVMEGLIYVKDNFDEAIIKTNLGNLTKTYCINDVLPYNSETDGSIQMNLYNGIFTQESWEERGKYNNVPVATNINEAIVGSLQTEFIDEQANTQYFQNEDSNARIVVFGHTHLPKIETYTNLKGETCIYANSGSWEDQKTRDKTADIDQEAIRKYFITIVPNKENEKRMLVSLYQYLQGEHTIVDSKEVEL